MNEQPGGVLEDLWVGTQILVEREVLDGFGHLSLRNPAAPEHYFMLRQNTSSTFHAEDVVELDRESEPVRPGVRPSIERFIHGEIYRARPDVSAIVHTHAPALIPFGVSQTPLKPLYHMSGFLSGGAPVFDIRERHGMTNMLVTSIELGQALAGALGGSALVLMRGHGATVVGSSVQDAVYRAIYATLNAQLQPIAMQLGGPNFLSDEEAALADELHQKVVLRPWEFWKERLRRTQSL